MQRHENALTDYFFGRQTITPSVSSPGRKHYHNHYEIYALLDGGVHYFIENATYPLEAGDIILIPPSMMHRTVYINNQVSERVLFSFSQDFLNASPDLLECFACHKINCASAMEILKKIEREYTHPDAYTNETIKGYALLLLSALSRCTEKARNISKPNTLNKSIQDAVIFINERFSEPITLEQIAKQYNLSEWYFSREFKKTTGFRFAEYLNTIRIKNAEELLINTNLSMLDISLQCGFNDSSYFSYVFRKANGLTPGKFRKTHRF